MASFGDGKLTSSEKSTNQIAIAELSESFVEV